jgi:Zn-dependent M28 family amino/carboxypeptidase
VNIPRTRLALGAVTATALALGTVTAATASGPDPRSTESFRDAVSIQKISTHLEAFQAIADEHGDRAAGRSGYQASVDYVVGQLEEAGYTPDVQEFEFDYFEENSELERISPDPRVYVNEQEFLRNTFDTGTPKGETTAPLAPVDLRLDAPDLPENTSNSGCEASDFAGFTPGDIALMQRGTCGFAVKALNAQAAGASGAIIMNEGQPGRRNELINMIGDATGLTIPVLYATFDTGADLAGTPGAQVRVKVDFEAETRTTYNVIAETPTGRGANTVMAGAHLDSVPEGAGINDNGTGSAALLETAIQYAEKNIRLRNKVRFAWWGAEESGLLGSEHYVAELTEEEAARIALYLNFDMVGSPNYMFGVYDGDNSGGTAPDGFIPAGSAEIEDVFEKFYGWRSQPFQDSEFSGRSDYGPFIAVGIPAGGLFTGAEVPKTAAEVTLYGGVAGAAYDPCYHQACDNLRGDGQDAALYAELRRDFGLIGNVNRKALRINADAIAMAVTWFARSTEAVNGDGADQRRMSSLRSAKVADVSGNRVAR